MRNLKKILALVLALMMTLSLMVTANATSFTDAGKIDADYEEAVEVLAGIGIFQGDNKGQFLPDTTLNRKDAAVLVYRLLSGDVGDKYLNNYKGYAAKEFSDVSASAWYEPYVAYAVNGNYIKGDGKGHFNPDADITGTEVLTILLRAVGYDQNNEFSQDWPVTVATLAKQLGVTDTVSGVLLTKAVTREVVAELIFQTIAYVPTVTYTPALGYNQYKNVMGWGPKNDTLGEDVFGLTRKEVDSIDAWGRPGYYWYANEISTKKPVATIAEDYIVAYKTAVTECQVASDYDFQGTKTLTTYINGEVNKTSTTMQATDTIGTIGKQGRLTEVYADRIVMIDTYLAYVKTVKAAVYDAAGHLKTPASSTLVVYDGTTDGNEYTIDETDWTKGSYVLVNAVTTAANSKTLDEGDDKYYEVVDYAPSFVGAQSTIWVNANQHVINGDTYDDAYNFILDEAKSTKKANFTWFKDQYGNVIGSVKIENPRSYAVLTSLYWNTGRPGYATATLLYVDGTEAEVEVNTIAGDAGDNSRIFGGTWNSTNFKPSATDGTEKAVRFGAGGSTVYVSDEGSLNRMYEGYALYEVESLSDGSVNLNKTNYLSATDAQVVNKATKINATGSAVYVDDATIFIVYNNGKYDRYVGKDSVPTFVSNKDSLFYVDTDKDNVAEYVYVNNGSTTDAGKALVSATDVQYASQLWENNKTVYVLRYAEKNGAAVKEGTIYSEDESVIKKLASNVGKLYLVVFDEDGYAISASEARSYNDGNIGVYRLVDDIEYTDGTGTLVGQYYDADSKSYVTDSWNVNYGDLFGDYTDLADVEDFDDVYIYVVLNAINGNFEAVYVYDKPEGAVEPDPADPVVTFDAELSKTGIVVTKYVDGVKASDGEATAISYTIYAKLVGTAEYAKYAAGTANFGASSPTKTIPEALSGTGNYYAVVEVGGKTITTETIAVVAP